MSSLEPTLCPPFYRIGYPKDFLCFVRNFKSSFSAQNFLQSIDANTKRFGIDFRIFIAELLFRHEILEMLIKLRISNKNIKFPNWFIHSN